MGLIIVGTFGFLDMIFTDPELYFVSGTIAGITWFLGMVGILLGRSTAKKWTSQKSRRVSVWIAISIPLLFHVSTLIIDSDMFQVWQSSGQANQMNEADLSVNTSELMATRVASTLETPIMSGTNLIWCASFQLAWNELSDFIGHEIHMQQEDPSVTKLNRKSVTEENVDKDTCVAEAGEFNKDFLDDLNKHLEDRFGSGAFPKEKWQGDWPTDSLAAFGYISVNLPFRYIFERLNDYPIIFGTNAVQGFGINGYNAAFKEKRRAASQVSIYDTKNEDDFIVELITRKTNHHLILAKVPPHATLQETIQSVNQRIAHSTAQKLKAHQELKIPILNFDLLTDYDDLTQKPLIINGSVRDEWEITHARQQIRFQLDERGAVLKTKAFVCVAMSEVSVDNYIFDKPFLVMLRYKENDQPYLALWVDNPELLLHAEGDEEYFNELISWKLQEEL